MPTVSVVTCTYNRAAFIGETLEHVLNQTFSDFEYIIIDEGSTDNTEDVVNSYKDSRVTYFKVPNSKGHLSKLRNIGMRHCTGKYIAIVDSDDLWLPEKLKLQVEVLEEDSSIGFSYTDVETFNKDGIIRKSLYKRSGLFKGSVFDDLVHNRFVICTTTLFFRKECLDKIGFQDEDFVSGDFDFILSLSAHFNAYAIYSPLVKVRRHSNNVSDYSHLNRQFAHLKVLQKALNKNLISKKKYKLIKTKIYYAFGIQSIHIREYKWANYFFLKSIGSNPLQLKPWVRLFFTLGKQMFNT